MEYDAAPSVSVQPNHRLGIDVTAADPSTTRHNPIPTMNLAGDAADAVITTTPPPATAHATDHPCDGGNRVTYLKINIPATKYRFSGARKYRQNRLSSISSTQIETVAKHHTIRSVANARRFKNQIEKNA
jgi:hypothetical protein